MRDHHIHLMFFMLIQCTPQLVQTSIKFMLNQQIPQVFTLILDPFFHRNI